MIAPYISNRLNNIKFKEFKEYNSVELYSYKLLQENKYEMIKNIIILFIYFPLSLSTDICPLLI